MDRTPNVPGKPEAMARAARAIRDLSRELEQLRAERREPVAIVGMACRFPGGANDPGAYWRLLAEGREGISDVPEDRWDRESLYDPDPDAIGTMYTLRGGFLDRPVDRFDARFFGLSPREAAAMDPQQRLLLELAWECLEDGGTPPHLLAASPTGVYIGISTADYTTLVAGEGAVGRIDAYSGTGNSFSAAAGQISHFLGLTGPSLAVDTACSSSLVAVSLAMQSLRSRQCEAALVGGVNLILAPASTIVMCRLRALSPDGRCHTFDARANGYVRGEGGGMVLLKRLSDAIEAGDPIHAVIRGGAVNHDGRSGGLTVPNPAAQRRVVRAALDDAGVDPAEVDLIEAHGTGTALGDPIEIRGLTEVFGAHRSPESPLTVGSVKTNLGHLEAAAGVAGLIKLALALKHEEIPRHLNFEQPSPHIPWDSIPIVVPTRPQPWRQGPRTRIAGVSSFGFTGTNAHLVLEEAPTRASEAAREPRRSVHILPLSARSGAALGEVAHRMEAHLDVTSVDVADACFTAGVGRSHMTHRAFVLGAGRDALAEGLRDVRDRWRGAEEASGLREASGTPGIVFLFPGQGAQAVGMARALLDDEPVFRGVLERLDSVSRDCLDRPLLSLLYPGRDDAPGRDPARDAAGRELLERTEYAQPAIFAVECALADLWRSWGIEPTAVVGHSLGEYAAAYTSGALPLEDGFRLVCERGRLMQGQAGSGRMALVLAPSQRVEEVLREGGHDLALAALNAPGQTVVSGDRETLDTALVTLTGKGVRHHPMGGTLAFHSPALDPVLDDLGSAASAARWGPPRIRMVSTLTGSSAGAAELGSPDYWKRQARDPVRFMEAVREARAKGGNQFLEVGPGTALIGAARRALGGAAGLGFLPSLREKADDRVTILSSLGELYARGASVDWEGFHAPFPARRISLPTYPFQRRRHWAFTDPRASGAGGTTVVAGEAAREPALTEPAPAGHDAAGAPTPRNSWLYLRRWEPSPGGAGTSTPGRWIVLADRGGAGTAAAHELESRGHRCDVLRPDSPLDQLDPLLRPGVDTLPLRGLLHFRNLDLASPSDTADAFDRIERDGLQSLVDATARVVESGRLTQSSASGERPRVWLVTRGGAFVGGTDTDGPGLAQAPAVGLGRVIAVEAPALWGGSIDLDPDSELSVDAISQLVDEVSGGSDELEVAFRGGLRLISRIVSAETADLAEGGYASPEPSPPVRIRGDGTYLVTGGLGVLGLTVAEWLAERGAEHLVLLSRSTSGSAVEVIRRLEAKGVNVHAPPLDVSNAQAVAELLRSLEAEGLPPVRGVIHAAGVLRPEAFEHITTDSMREVMRAKAEGAWILHELLEGVTLDFFVLFSSMAAMAGAPGLGTYAAANAFLDALAFHRRAGRKPAVSLAWGPWGKGGMAGRTDASERERWSRAGIDELDPDEALRRVGELLGATFAHVGVMAARPEVVGEDVGRGERAASSEDGSGRLLDQLAAQAPEDRTELLLGYLREEVAGVLMAEVGEVPVDRNAVEIGLDSIMAMELVALLNRDLEITLFPQEIFERTSLEELAGYLLEAAPVPRERPQGSGSTEGGGRAPSTTAASSPTEASPPLLAGRAMEAARTVPIEPYRGPRVPGVVLLLSSPRSGSTLLRVMLEGHPRLFCPPELHLLPFAGMRDRRERLGGSHLDEGLPRGLMQLLEAGPEEALALERAWVEEDLPIPEVYRLLGKLAGEALLVDKSPTYGASPEILERAESIFEDVRYIHLVRHPHPAIESFVRNRFDRLVSFGGEDPGALAEDVWASSNANIVDHLAGIDPGRHVQVRFEELVREPARVMEGLAGFLGIPFVPELLEPYEGDRMTDGLHESSRGIGDPNLLDRNRIDPALADAWRSRGPHRRLGGFARRVAKELGYGVAPHSRSGSHPEPLFFGPEDSPLFGVYSGPSPYPLRDSAVVLCNALGQEYIRSHAALASLARDLANEGFPVLRFDYFGTGDSAGEAEEGGIDRWTADVRDAIEQVKRSSGLERVILVGMRLGASMAALAAEGRRDVERLVLWAPVADGEAYLHELGRLQREFLKSAYVTVPGGAPNGDEMDEALGFPISEDLRRDLGGLELHSAIGRPPRSILALDLQGGVSTERLASHLEGGGARVSIVEAGGRRAWLAEPYQAFVPADALSTIVDWVANE